MNRYLVLMAVIASFGVDGAQADVELPSNSIRGYVDGLSPDGQTVFGWACVSGDVRSLRVSISLDGSAGSAFVKGDANVANEWQVDEACGHRKQIGAHRFAVTLPIEVIAGNPGRRIIVTAHDSESGDLILNGNKVVLPTTGFYNLPPPVDFDGRLNPSNSDGKTLHLPDPIDPEAHGKLMPADFTDVRKVEEASAVYNRSVMGKKTIVPNYDSEKNLKNNGVIFK